MRKFGFILLTLITFCSCKNDVPIIDCHVHLWDTRRPEGIHWPRPEHKFLYKPFLPKDIAPIARKNNVKAIVAMQSGQTTADNQWNLDIIEKDPIFKGVIGNLSRVIATDKFKPLLEKLTKNPKYLGFRLSGKYQEGLSDELMRDLKLTADKGLAVDFLVGGYSFKDIRTIAEKFPNLRIMLDHIGGVNLNKPLSKEWITEMKAMKKYKNVYCKVSALYGRYSKQPASQDIKDYKVALDLAWEIFGEDRLVYSSDWPVTERTDDYTSVVKLTKAYFAPKGKRITKKVFYDNAKKFYRVPGLD